MSWLLFPFWNGEERRPRAVWRMAIALLAIGPLSFALELASRALRAAIDGRLAGTLAQGVVFLIWSLLVVLALALTSRFVDRRPLSGLGLRLDARWIEDAAFGVALGALLMSGILGVEVALGWARYAPAADLSGAPRAAYVPAAALVFVAVAVNEELVFRGNQLKNLAEGLSSRWIPPRSAVVLAVVISSAVFGLAHAGNPSASAVSTGNIVLAGGMLAAGYLTTGRLGIAIGLHFSWNFFQNLYGMPVSGQTRFFASALLVREEAGADWITGGAFGPEAGMTGLSAMIVGTLLTLAWVRLRCGRLRIDASIAAPPARAR